MTKAEEYMRKQDHGINIKCCADSEQSNKVLTPAHALVPKFVELLTSGQAHAQHTFQHILDSHLTWRNLEGVENALLWGKIITQPVPW